MAFTGVFSSDESFEERKKQKISDDSHFVRILPSQDNKFMFCRPFNLRDSPAKTFDKIINGTKFICKPAGGKHRAMFDKRDLFRLRVE